jgi:hypothetical protein
MRIENAYTILFRKLKWHAEFCYLAAETDVNIVINPWIP